MGLRKGRIKMRKYDDNIWATIKTSVVIDGVIYLPDIINTDRSILIHNKDIPTAIIYRIRSGELKDGTLLDIKTHHKIIIGVFLFNDKEENNLLKIN